VFEAFLGQRNISIRRRRLGGHAIAIALHALAITAVTQLPRAPHAPTAVPAPRTVPVHIGLTLSEACLRRTPPAARALANTGADPAPRSRRRQTTPPTRPLAAPAATALALREPTPMSEAVVSAAPTSRAEPPTAAESLAPGVIMGAAGTAAASAVNDLPSSSLSRLQAGESRGEGAGIRAAPLLAPPRRASRFLPEALAQQQKVAGAPPEFPASLATEGANFVIQARICVGPGGQVDLVELLRTAHPTLDANVISAVGRWRYRPLMAGGIAVPFCTLVRFEFRAT
jgi:hypothetical protein